MTDRHPEPVPDLSDLLQRAAGGDESAWRRVIDLYGRRVYALARSRCRQADVAEEVTQSVFATVATKLKPAAGSTPGTYTEQGRFEAWLFRIAINRIRDELRRRRRHAEPTDPGVRGAREARDAPSESGAEAELGALRRAVARLSEADREIIELRHHAGLPFNQICDLLGEPLGTLLARHHRALKKLKDLLGRQDEPHRAKETA